MAAVDNLRNNIIGKLLSISNEAYLSAIDELVSKSSISSNFVNLTEEQILMLELSEADIKNGRLIPQDQLDEQDLAWLKGL